LIVLVIELGKTGNADFELLMELSDYFN